MKKPTNGKFQGKGQGRPSTAKRPQGKKPAPEVVDATPMDIVPWEAKGQLAQPDKPKMARSHKPTHKAAKTATRPVSTSGARKDLIEVTLHRGKSKPFWIGHPWIFSGAIASVDGEVGPNGANCVVKDERDNALGFGHYNPAGQIAIRLLSHRRSTEVPFELPELRQLVDQRIQSAIELRQTLGFPNAETNVYRLINAEGDHLPGLIVDRLGDVTSIQFGTYQMMELQSFLVQRLAELLPTSRTVISVTETSSRLEGLPMTLEFEPELDEKTPVVEVMEKGLRYRINLENIQKTGFYADQRENRARFAEYCKGKRVLDAYCHVGGFGLQAARAGASEVVQVDSSSVAITGAKASAELNGVAKLFEHHVSDAVTFLKECQATGRTFDRIIVDPPKLAQGRANLDEAIQKYARLNTLAMACLAPGGLLLTNSCSRHMSEEDFGRMLTEAGHRLRKSVRIHERWGQPSDHPTLSVAPEGRYLKSWLVSLGD